MNLKIFIVMLLVMINSAFCQMILRSSAGDTLMVVRDDTTMGIGVKNPVERIDVNGGLRIGNTENKNAGTIRWTGANFEGYDGSQWITMFSSPADQDWHIDGTDMYSGVPGNVGIGMTNPAEKLHISGDVLATEQVAVHGATVNDQYAVNIGNLTGTERAINITATGADWSATALYFTVRDPVSTGAVFGIWNDVQGRTWNDFAGVYNDLELGKAQGMYNTIKVRNGYGYGVRNYLLECNDSFGWGFYNNLVGHGGLTRMVGLQNKATIRDGGGTGLFFNSVTGTYNNLTAENDGIYQALIGTQTVFTTSPEDTAWALHVTDNDEAAGTQYGVYMDLDGSGENYSIWVEETSGISYFGPSVGIGTSQPRDILDVAGNAYVSGVLDHSTEPNKPKIFYQTTEPDIPDDSSAFWVNSTDDKYYLVLDYGGVQKKLELQ